MPEFEKEKPCSTNPRPGECYNAGFPDTCDCSGRAGDSGPFVITSSYVFSSGSGASTLLSEYGGCERSVTCPFCGSIVDVDCERWV